MISNINLDTTALMPNNIDTIVFIIRQFDNQFHKYPPLVFKNVMCSTI